MKISKDKERDRAKEKGFRVRDIYIYDPGRSNLQYCKVAIHTKLFTSLCPLSTGSSVGHEQYFDFNSCKKQSKAWM